MKTFEEVKSGIIEQKLAVIHRIETGQVLEHFSKEGKKYAIDSNKSQIENADECAVIEIGACTNSIIYIIQELYKGRYQKEYIYDFNAFINNYIINRTNGAPSADGYSRALGIKPEDLEMFRGKNPFSDEVCDNFRKLVNINYGTQIPTAEEVRQARKTYDEVSPKASEEEKAIAFCKLKEVQRDSGALLNGGTYYTLATNKYYQEQKAISSGRSESLEKVV